MRITAEETHTIFECLELALRIKIEEFDTAETMPDKVSQQRAVRAARDAKRISRLLVHIANVTDIDNEIDA